MAGGSLPASPPIHGNLHVLTWEHEAFLSRRHPRSRPPGRPRGVRAAASPPSLMDGRRCGCGTCPRPHRPVTLLWLKLWRCAEPACVATTSEGSEHVRPRASLTQRARRAACRLVGEDGLDVAAVAALLGVGWHTAKRAVRDYGTPLIDDRRAPQTSRWSARTRRRSWLRALARTGISSPTSPTGKIVR
jgi:hypothetical protein